MAVADYSPEAPLRGGALAVTAVALALGTFMQVLDSTIANVSLPTIAGNLGVSSDNSTWIITAFAVANGAAVPLTGWLMGRFGVVRTFCASVALFTLASFLCGIAWNLPSLIIFRVMQGAVSGPMIPGSQALLIAIFPHERRATALSIWSMTTLVAPIMGPVLGGYISDNLHWSWIFLINVPIGLGCAVICWQSLRTRETPTRRLPIDTVGLALLILWVGCLQVMLDLGKDDDWFHSTRIVVLTAVAAAVFLFWLVWELTDAAPIVDLSLFRQRNFLVGTVALCLGYAVFFANGLILPLWLQTQLGYTATWAGLVSAPSGVVAVLLTPFMSRASARFDARLLASMAFGFFSLSYFLRSGYTTQVGFWNLVMPLLAQGVAVSVFFVALLTITLDGIPAQRIPAASGISNFSRIVASSFAASGVTTLWDRREALHQGRLADAVTAGSPAWTAARDGLAQMGIGSVQAAATITRQLVGQAYLLASDDLFRLSSWITAGLVGIVWLTRRPSPPQGPVAAD